MSKERLKQADDWIKSMYDLLSLKTDEEDRAYTQNKIDLFKWMKEQAERADMLAHENMNIRKGYQERSKQVQELERVNKQLKNNLSVYKGYYKNMIKINEDIVEENKKYRNLIKDMGREIEVLTDVMSNADNADELNEEMIRLKGELENIEYALQESYRQEQQYALKLEGLNKRYREAIKEAIEEEEQNLEGYESNVYKILLEVLEELE